MKFIPISKAELIVNHADRKLKMHLVEAAALFHLDFEGIHPFIDGNGQTGRLLINLELDEYYRNQNELPMLELAAGYVDERLEQYLKVLP